LEVKEMTVMPAVFAAPQLLTLSDIADLAQVQRPVVSMWRARTADTDRPFPSVFERHDGRDVFLGDEVVTWLEQTGRGNNPAVRQDVAAAAALDVLPPGDRQVVVNGLMALLVLKTQLGIAMDGLSAVDLLDLADDVDPEDRSIHREIAALGDDAGLWARHADVLASAAFTPAGAANVLVGRHRRLGLSDVTAYALAPEVLRLVAGLVFEFTSEEAAAVALVAPFGDAGLLTGIGDDRQDPGVVALPDTDTPAARHARRVLLIQGWEVVEAVEDDGLVFPAAGSTVVAQLPSATRPDLTDSQIVEALGDVEAALPGDAHAIVVGPASVLCGRLPQALQSARATVLRSGRVRAILRLPSGLWPARSRQELAMWIFAPGPADVRSDRHRTAVADLRSVRLDTAVVEDVVTDVAVVANPQLDPYGHAFRFSRFVVTSRLIASSGDLVPAHPGRVRDHRPPADFAFEIAAQFGQAATPTAALAPWQVRPGEVAGVTTVPLGHLIEAGDVRLVQGNRLDPADVTGDTGARVHTTETLTGVSPAGSVLIDRLRLAAEYPRSRYTQPGDVVFCTAPRPAAVIDREGFSIVAAPARVLRLAPNAQPGLLPEVLAQAISQASGSGGWRLWPVPLIPAAQIDAVRSALAAVAEAREAAAARVTTLDALAAGLVRGVASGSVTLVGPVDPAQMEG
jgi:hypothetical protein